MKLRNRLLVQNFKVLTVTVFVTVCLTLIVGQIYIRKQGPQNGAGYQTALLIGDEVIFAGPTLTEYQVRTVLLDLSLDKTVTELAGRRYEASLEQFVGRNGTLYTLLKLCPVFAVSGFYRNMLLFIIIVFLVSFVLSTLALQRRHEQDIIAPLVRLRSAADQLAAGDLNAAILDEGVGEVNELCLAVENLRLKLKESVLQNKKYDENRTFLLSSISHDLKTPVTAVRGYIDGVLDGVADTADKRRAYLEKAIEKIELLTTMIDDLLLYSKLDSGQMPFSFSRVPALAYIQSVLDDSRPAFEAEGRQLVLSDELKSTAVLRLDAERFRRVVQNILDNAKKHTQPGTGKMTVSLRETTASVVMEFHDNGEGIPAADLPHVFDRFYRADSARTTGGGSGLGLAIARQLVTGMGGRIWAVSRPGEGCSILLSMKKVKLTDGKTEA